MEVRELNKKIKNTLPIAERDELIKKMHKEDEKVRKGMFEFLDAQGGWLEFSYRKYAEPIQIIKLIHGEICDLPMGIIKHLNNTKRKVRRYSLELPSNSNGRVPRSYETISRVRFTPTDVL